MVRKEVCCDKKTTFVVRLHHLSNVSNLFILFLISEDLYVFSMQDVMCQSFKDISDELISVVVISGAKIWQHTRK
jgi:hypothetical protein